MIRKVIMILIGLLALVLVFAISVFIFINTSPEFGQIPEGKDLERMTKSSNYKDGFFQNNVPTSLDWPFEKMTKIFYKMMFNKNKREPGKTLPQRDIMSNELKQDLDTNMHIRWFGHSAFLVQIDGKTILLDPMMGNTASPVSFMGPKRFNTKLPIEIDSLPEIDAVIYSHDHYDHLDYGSVILLKEKVNHWYVALGMGSHLKRWGIDESKITEMDWWEETHFQNLTLVACPARHFSGRGLNDRFKTFWNSWVIIGERQNLYFSGDGGYSKNFKEIGDKYGPFDLCLIECGAYNEAWHDIHMMPEESAQACIDLKGKIMMPIHWGAFNLALHDWDEPIKRVSKKAKELNIHMISPIIGEEVIVPSTSDENKWWEE